MAQRRKFVVWEWKENGSPRFVGWGRVGRNHPAKDLWARRMGCDSDLNHWLRSHQSEPERVDHSLMVNYYKDEASSVAASLRRKYTAEGHTLLDPRPWGTREGGGAARMVMSPDLAIYSSVRQAATDNGVNPSTITRWCQSDGWDWDYVN
jgi:hypothetical protein